MSRKRFVSSVGTVITPFKSIISLPVFALFVYKMVLHGCIIMGVHGLSAGKATLIVLIFPMFIVGLAVIALFALIILIGAELAGDALPGLFEFGAWLHGDRFPGESKERDETRPPTKW